MTSCFLSPSCPTHPDLQLWRLPWRSGEGPTALANQRADTEGSNSGLAGSYVSSEHCYQKTEASWENEEKHENITASGTSQNYKVLLQSVLYHSYSLSFITATVCPIVCSLS